MDAQDQQIIDALIPLARECGRIAYEIRMDPQATQTQQKVDKSLVTVADGKLEELIKNTVINKFGGDFVGEESGTTKGTSHAEYQWIVDPIDGTTNFSKGTAEGNYPDLPTWGISIGLKKQGKPHIGVIYKPQTDELFYAVSGEGAFVETTKFGKTYTRKLGLVEDFKDTRTIAGFGVMDRTTLTDTHLKIYHDFKDVVRESTSSQTSRSQGASGIELTSVACGTYASYIGLVAEHDIAAARVILQEAGASLSEIPAPIDKPGYFYIVASHPQIHTPLVDALTKAISPSKVVTGNLAAESIAPIADNKIQIAR